MRGLAAQKKSLWVLTFPTELERSEVLVARAFRNLRKMQSSFFKREEVLHGYLALFGAIKEMLAKLRREIVPLHLRHQLPNVIRASCSRSRSVSAGSLDV